MAVLNSNPEIVLRKRKDADRKRVEKQDAARVRMEKKGRKVAVPGEKFLRAEVLASRATANKIEGKRLENILKHEQAKAAISAQKETPAKLAFIIRTEKQNKAVSIPTKALNVFKVLRLDEPNMGVFVKLTPTIEPVLKLISPFIVVGTPSLASVRHLFQKRACIPSSEDDQSPSKLDNNQAVEDKFGDDLGFICIEDLIHEITSLGDNFKAVTLWLAPFSLTAPVNGWSPLAKLAKMRYQEENKKATTLAGHAKLEEIDIDKFIEEQN
ncbi:ribosomal protein L30p/L7e [Metschnikowia bicuspidata var. bicuspidata NRRL YB-4993]|uniref:Ribosomal protein L30p/L7e n=1 Tax=Metschnikowia bicuspidata var. bicuspidata NRRL YB-4993 TaxID=869754 RepID=A0A1A0H922_9ASCO|nr:ribosomal protein L30p/L7e [Metschnikowia bicuspidata var. bicuspidata NRRL YB-4993]OBA20506.1 ribosomal protein L30p/L7e [Metschnikowia bicuspidata var. bicuspidata NRRL YB-4993]